MPRRKRPEPEFTIDDLFGEQSAESTPVPDVVVAECEPVVAPEPEPEPARKPQSQNACPLDWHPPATLLCGHLDFYKPEEHEAARAEGFCCAAGKEKTPPLWNSLQGSFDVPLPKYVRRTEEKVKMGGFPGYCCDSRGYYIGGIGNDCRYFRPPGTTLCPFHQNDKES